MKITPKQYAQTLFEVTKDSSADDMLKILDKFLKILVDNNQFSQIEKILSNFNEIWNRENNILEAEIITARELSEIDLLNINKFVKRKAGKSEVAVKMIIDESLKGGFVVRLRDEIFDSSLRNRIASLKQALNN